MTKKLSWQEITSDFSGKWVELTDCDWEWTDANPKSARVKNYSSDRKKLISRNNKDSVILFISKQTLFNSNSLINSYSDYDYKNFSSSNTDRASGF